MREPAKLESEVFKPKRTWKNNWRREAAMIPEATNCVRTMVSSARNLSRLSGRQARLDVLDPCYAQVTKICVRTYHNFRASGSVRRHCPLPFLLLPLSLVCLVCSVVLSPSLCSPSSPSSQASLSSISLSLSLSLSLHCSVTSPLSCLDVQALPLHDPVCHLTTGFLLDFSFMSLSRFP